MVHIPYKGGADMYAGALAGDIQMVIAAVHSCACRTSGTASCVRWRC